MSVLIGHASISEKGTINGAPGDQTGKEVCTRNWYSKPWNVMLICTDKALAARAAQEMRYACANNNIGYGQNDRRTAYDSAVKNGRTFKNAKGNTDCSQLVAGCYILAGLSGLSADCYTGNLRQALLNTGKFKAYTDSAHLNSDAYAEVGAVYLKEGSHVVMALENGLKAGSSSSTGMPMETSTNWTGKVNTPKGVNVRSTPEVTPTNKIKAITNGTVVKITKESGNWGYDSNSGGWVCLDYIKKTSGSSTSSSGSSSLSGYKVGNTYILRSNMKVRTGPGTNYRAKGHSELTADGKKHDKDKNGCLEAGTRVTCKAVKKVGNATWIQCPSGWICAKDGSKTYVS